MRNFTVDILTEINEIPLRTYDYAMVVSQMTLSAFIVSEFVRYFKMGKIYPPMWNILNLDKPLIQNNMRNDPFLQITPKECILYNNSNTIEINAMYIEPSVDYNILFANPFTFLHKRGIDTYCVYEYAGPIFVMYS